MKILDSNIQDTPLVPSKSGLLKKSFGRVAQISLSFQSRLFEVLKTSRSDVPEAKAEPAPVPAISVEAKSNEAKASKESPAAAPVPTTAEDRASLAPTPVAREAAPEPEAADAEAPKEEEGEKPNQTAKAEPEPMEGEETAEASMSAENGPKGALVETAQAEAIETVEVREVRFEAHMKLSRALSKEELEGLRAELRKIAGKLDQDPAGAAADFVAVVEQLVGRAEIAKSALEIPIDGAPKDLLGAGDGHLRRMLAHFEKIVGMALAREERSAAKNVREATLGEMRAQIHGARLEEGASNENEKAQRIVERVVQVIETRRRSEPEKIHAQNAEAAKAVEEAAKSEGPKALERILPKRAQEAPRRAQEDSAETPRRAEIVAAEMKSAVRIAAVSTEAVMTLERRPNHRADGKENPPMKISIQTEGISEARSNGSNQTPFWQNAYDHGSRRTEASFAKNAAAANQAMVPKEEIFSQIVQSARITLVDGKGEARLQLNPEHLGKVEIRVTTEDGKARVQVTAESQSVTRLLSENLAELKTALEASGLEVGQLDVQLGQGDLREHDEASREGENRKRHNRTNEATPETEDDGTIVSLAWAALGRREFVA